ncbi:HNH endonuclease [Actinomarinicola tropica]|uniref:HNH endonuclease n=1 Tax=Actinomarinicola tropica TaxID=2789776 RepID=A0A5Q2RF93_9ACTN|nr:HNH endonuclease [Actinomarinicola tropica]QGG94353.1 HNH endonuclease [Actinomarinicola tropica]
MARGPDIDVRLAAFQFLEEQTRVWGEVLPWRPLAQGFTWHGRRVPLVSQQGIFKPAVLEQVPLSIRTTPEAPGRERPYDDGITEEGLLLYRYRGTDLAHRDNVGLRIAMQEHIPIIHFMGITKGQYLASWPVYVVGDDPSALAFTVALAEPEALAPDLSPAVAEDARKAYYRAVTKRRLHQAVFRERVLHAYSGSCGICRLRHVELLDAAHILPDSHPRGEPVVPNGLALCKIHHAAFDTNILGVRPDLVVEVRKDLLLERDGPMLRHGIQEMDGSQLTAPRRQEWRPSRELLEERYEEFRNAS